MYKLRARLYLLDLLSRLCVIEAGAWRGTRGAEEDDGTRGGRRWWQRWRPGGLNLST